VVVEGKARAEGKGLLSLSPPFGRREKMVNKYAAMI